MACHQLLAYVFNKCDNNLLLTQLKHRQTVYMWSV